MHLHANWRADDVVSGDPFVDWNFIEITGRGVLVGDQWTVLNPNGGWWGEGDEKIYVDDDFQRDFPSHFGTGTEDYYGWAGGHVPTREDEFSHPLLSNIRVGGLDGGTRGFNICTRQRGFDAVTFTNRLRFDIESSLGVDIRTTRNLLAYSAVTWWYARRGAVHNRPPLPEAAAEPITSLEQLDRRSSKVGDEVKHRIEGAIEMEDLRPTAESNGWKADTKSRTPTSIRNDSAAEPTTSCPAANWATSSSSRSRNSTCPLARSCTWSVATTSVSCKCRSMVGK